MIPGAATIGGIVGVKAVVTGNLEPVAEGGKLSVRAFEASQGKHFDEITTTIPRTPAIEALLARRAVPREVRPDFSGRGGQQLALHSSDRT
jgi:hypothetical protein